jgi:lipoprotein-anchoring transpeptidase ErfK/SrfK
MLASMVVAGCGGSRQQVTEAGFRYPAGGLIAISRPDAIASLATRALAADLGHLPRGTSAVAWAVGRQVGVYRSPGDRRPARSFPIHNEFGVTQVFLVKRATPGWLEIYLPVRPNDGTGWVRSADVRLKLDPYLVVVDTARHELTVRRAGRAVMRAPVGIGKPATPTPHGLFYVLEELRMVPPTGPYGTYAFGLSAYSDVLTTFGTGQAQIALHGTDEPASIGENTSNGCVHLRDSVANWLARTLPLGTPVRIV